MHVARPLQEVARGRDKEHSASIADPARSRVSPKSRPAHVMCVSRVTIRVLAAPSVSVSLSPPVASQSSLICLLSSSNPALLPIAFD